MSASRRVSVIIPARNEEARVAQIVRAVRQQHAAGVELEIIVVDDGSDDRTAQVAEGAGARVIRLPAGAGNPARARNVGAGAAQGNVLVFLDCDCLPRSGWLRGLLANLQLHPVVGGSLALPRGLSLMARLDYYCGWYHVHPRRPGGLVRQHPPGNLGVRRDCFERTAGFVDRQPIAYAHEELEWQSQCLTQGATLYFAPRAIVDHYNRPGLANLLARNYRWGYSAIAAKAETNVARLAWLYRHPILLLSLTPALPILTTPYVVVSWLRAGVIEPLLMWPVVFLARCAHALGMFVGGVRWLHAKRRGDVLACRPRWE